MIRGPSGGLSSPEGGCSGTWEGSIDPGGGYVGPRPGPVVLEEVFGSSGPLGGSTGRWDGSISLMKWGVHEDDKSICGLYVGYSIYKGTAL